MFGHHHEHQDPQQLAQAPYRSGPYPPASFRVDTMKTCSEANPDKHFANFNGHLPWLLLMNLIQIRFVLMILDSMMGMNLCIVGNAYWLVMCSIFKASNCLGMMFGFYSNGKWILSWSVKVRDEEGFAAFALVNKATELVEMNGLLNKERFDIF